MPRTERTLVVGIDYSDFCIPALDQALRMAGESPGTRLVPVLALPYNTAVRSSGTETAQDEFVEHARDNLVRLVQERAHALGVSSAESLPEVCFGAPAACLLRCARELGAELILVGSHGRQGLQHLLLGSVSEEVVRAATCSVLVARALPSQTAASMSAHREAAPDSAGSGLEFSPEGVGADPAIRGDAATELLSEPHLDAGRVVLHVLDVSSGQSFVCSFRDLASVNVEALERQWVPQPSSDVRARVARVALAEARREAPRFEQIFKELARRAHPRATP
jgi:nucleotide-binding universal stress UspA family protein